MHLSAKKGGEDDGIDGSALKVVKMSEGSFGFIKLIFIRVSVKRGNAVESRYNKLILIKFILSTIKTL